MDRELKILLVEGDSTECMNIIKAVDKTEGIRLIGVTNSADKAIEGVISGKPDAVILDIELHKSSKNGVSFMQQLRGMNLATFPYVLLTTNTGASANDTARDIGADFVMSKQQADYSADSLIGFLSSIKSIILGKKKSSSDVFIAENNEDRDKRLFRRIHTELDLIGVSPKVVGRTYIVESIFIIMEKPEPNFSRKVAAKFGKSVPSVERAMQTAITGAWKNNKAEELTRHYTARISPTKGIPTVTEFIYFYAAKVKNDW